MFVVAPMTAQASVLDDLRAQISSLLQMIIGLQQQLTQLENTDGQSIREPLPFDVQAVPEKTRVVKVPKEKNMPKPWCPQILRNLKISDRGADVSTLQQHLQKLGYFTYPEITQYYGPATSNAVRKWKQARGLYSSNRSGSLTFNDRVYLQSRCVRIISNQIEPVATSQEILSSLQLSPLYNNTLRQMKLNLNWQVRPEVKNKFNKYGSIAFDLISKRTGKKVSSIGDGFKLMLGDNYTYNFEQFIRDGAIQPGQQYKIQSKMRYLGGDFICDPAHKYDCNPTYPADVQLLDNEAQKYISESDWFLIDSSVANSVNQAPVVESLTGPTNLRTGERGTWIMVTSDDNAEILEHSCRISKWGEQCAPAGNAPGAGTCYMSVLNIREGGVASNLPFQFARPGRGVTFEYVPTTPTTGKEYYEISCRTKEGFSLSTRQGKSMKFYVSGNQFHGNTATTSYGTQSCPYSKNRIASHGESMSLKIIVNGAYKDSWKYRCENGVWVRNNDKVIWHR